MSNTRLDGRRAGEIRPTNCTLGVLERADGSASWSQGNTSVLVAVYGPKEAGVGREDPEKALVDVLFKPQSQADGTPGKTYQQALRDMLQGLIVADQHPRTLVNVVVQVTGDDGGVLACSVNAAIAALIDAGIPIYDRCSAITLAIDGSGELAIDPTKAEEKKAAACGCFAYRASSDSPVLTIIEGRVSADTVPSMIQAAKPGCETLSSFLRKSIDTNFADLTSR